MVAEMSYSTVSNVIDTWEMVRRRENYEQEVGTKLFQRFFIIEPEAKEIFGFKADMDPTSDEVIKNRRFIKHAQFFVQMIDRALALLGPEIELLTEIMLDLGEKHVRYGVRAEFFPAMGTALIHAVSQVLGEDHFTDEIRADWLEVYGALSYDMIRGQKQAH